MTTKQVPLVFAGVSEDIVLPRMERIGGFYHFPQVEWSNRRAGCQSKRFTCT
jgi:hypothetical protein